MIEYKVRPVTRFVVTRYHQNEASAGVETCGEFDNARQAGLVAGALAANDDGNVQKQYVIVGIHTFQVENKAYFAESRAEAEQILLDAEATHGMSFQIFERIKLD